MKKINIVYCLGLALLIIGCTSPKEKTSIRYATFNIRYDNPADSLNNWKFRKEAVCKFILDKNIEVLGMQEVLHSQMNDLKEGLPGYSAVGVAREDGDTQGEYAPVFYRAARFELLDSQTFWLSQYPDSVGFIGWDGACTRIATWAKLKDKANGQVFMAVNTHFDHVGIEARRQAALLIISRIKEIAGDYPAILTGDLNVSEQSEAYKILTSNEYVLQDACRIAEKTEGVAYTFHNFGRIPDVKREKIDFIFVSSGVRVLTSEIPQEGKKAGGYLSDHNPQIADIEF